ESVALVSAYIASRLPGISRDEAHTFGLFHNCGMPLLEARFPEYADTVRNCRSRIAVIEDAHFCTNHATLGYLLTKSWNLPEQICEATQRHHDPTVFGDNASGKTPTLVAIAMLANNAYRTFHKLPSEGGWEEDRQLVLDHLGLTELEYDDLIESAHQELAEAD
ncbi:MAG TPA: HDOD domain-containing protein, partial [Burkholderiales bacterium]|nr:HDOD domain-containing protein [Burkholderiales bacterium]